MADVLTSGPPPGAGRPRRWAVVAAALVLAGGAGLVAVRSATGRPDPAPAATAGPTAEPTAPPAPALVPVPVGGPGVVSVAVGRQHAYALVAQCDAAAVRACAYRLLRRDVDATGWTTLPPRPETRSTVGVFPVVVASGTDVVTVFEGPGGRSYSSVDGGPFAYHRVTPGTAIDEFPADGVLCTACLSPVTVLEPATGRLRPLRSQPAFPGRRLQSVRQRGRVLWAVATGRAGTAAAVSVDWGRTWRAGPVPVDPGVDGLELVIGPGGAGYLLGTTLGGPGGPEGLSGVWAAEAPGRAWRRLPGPVPPGVRSTLADDRGLLATDLGGTVWRLRADGTFAALPDPGPTRPAELAAGGGRLIVATPRGGIPDPQVLTSGDGGETWRTERLG